MQEATLLGQLGGHVVGTLYQLVDNNRVGYAGRCAYLIDDVDVTK